MDSELSIILLAVKQPVLETQELSSKPENSQRSGGEQKQFIVLLRMSIQVPNKYNAKTENLFE